MKLFFYCLREFDELEPARACAEKYGIEFGYTTAYPTQENVALAAGYDGVSMTPCDMGTAMVEAFAAVGVKYILCHSIGYDHVDIARAHALGMRVANVGYPPDGVADHAVMLILMCLRKAAQGLKRSDLQDYSLQGKIGRDLASCTVGVIGTGNIGRGVLRRLSGFGCKLLAYDVHQDEEAAALAEYLPLETLLAKSDVLTLHAPLNEGTRHLLKAETLALCKPGVVVVNTARGGLIETDALLDALLSGQVGAAGLDVLEHENGLYYYNRMGDVVNNRRLALLRAMPNVTLTPHVAFYTETNVNAMVEGNFRSLYLMGNGQTDPHEL